MADPALVALAERLQDVCIGRGLTVATAESCTGGLIGYSLTEIPGSSEYYLGGVIGYSNAAKIEQLGVPAKTIDQHGAVSAQTAVAMAEGARRRFGADYGISVTGVAGPGGGSPEKPVGLVYIHAVTPEVARGIEFTYGQDRESIRRRATVSSLHLLRRLLAQSRDEAA